ncbi:hypothetical protein Pcinc_028148 [Petrolisthes cinctipes]|uniref:Uncharacterized protein n=1 Tax=Petrolisthes cinctipes TaxID=88211 RepID=A0AAE1F2N0_PETCI|nr:hypothetical protein Pcinc_028148 [Petrolisthes cinctipes]
MGASRALNLACQVLVSGWSRFGEMVWVEEGTKGRWCKWVGEGIGERVQVDGGENQGERVQVGGGKRAGEGGRQKLRQEV